MAITTTTHTLTSTGGHQIVVPFGVIGIEVECWGGGGAGGARNTIGGGGGGKGGGYAQKDFGSDGTSSFTNSLSSIIHGIQIGGIIQCNVGDGGDAAGSPSRNGGVSEVIGTDKETIFCRATGGDGVAPNTCTGSSSTNGTAVGDTIYTGGNGATCNDPNGGGGGEGACSNGNGNAGSAPTGGSGCDGGDGGDGFSEGSGEGNPGSTTGGGGGGCWTELAKTTLGGDGGRGKIIMTIYVENGVIAGMDEFC